MKSDWNSRVLLLIAALGTAACNGSPTSPTDPPAPPPPANAAPQIGSMSVAESGYRTGRITAASTDADGQIVSGTVDWGDGSTSPITNGFGSINLTHRYAQAQSYTVTLRVMDDDGAESQLARSVNIRVPPEACLDVLILDVCARSTSNFKNLNVAVRAGAVSLASFTISDGNPSITVPLGGGFGRLTLSHNFNTGRLSISGEACPVPFLVCESIGSRTIQF